MKRLLSILLFIPVLGFSQYTAIPDQYFEQALIDLGHDNVIDGQVLTASISGVESLIVPYQNISDFTGIEDFIALTNLNCDSNQLTNLDVSQNTALTFLNCRDNQLTSLDVSQNTALTYLSCQYNPLNSLDVSNNIALTELDCEDNQLNSLDVSHNIALDYLDCENNQLTSLDVSNNIALTELDCEDNPLNSLDVSNNTALEHLDCENNQLTSLDLSQNTALTNLNCRDNQLTSLDVSNNTILTVLYCENNQLTSLDLSQNTALQYLKCQLNQLTCLNLINGNNLNFDYIYTYNNPNLTCIEVDDVNYSNTIWLNSVNFQLDDNHYFSNDCDYPAGCGSFNCDDIIINDTTDVYVADIIFQNQSPDYSLIVADTFQVSNEPNCDSIVMRYNKYIFNPNYCTDSTNTNDTSYVLIYDTITTYDTSYVSIGVTDTLYIDITIIPPTGTIDITNTISIYPNPANDFITINNGNFSTMTNYELRILNSLGQEVFSNLVVVPQFIIPVSSLGAEGTYFVQVLDGDGNLVVTKYLILN